MADIDHFKRVNDDFGHRAGDAVLQHVASLLQKAIRQDDALYRYAGEEFLLVLTMLLWKNREPSQSDAGAGTRVCRAKESTRDDFDWAGRPA
jgi:GGDEF domain-containing protein